MTAIVRRDMGYLIVACGSGRVEAEKRMRDGTLWSVDRFGRDRVRSDLSLVRAIAVETVCTQMLHYVISRRRYPLSSNMK